MMSPARQSRGLWVETLGVEGIGIALLALHCGTRPLLVPMRQQPPSVWGQAVSGPPPAVRIEELPREAPSTECRFEPGTWLPVQGQWQWQPGRWVEPPEDCAYAPANLQWRAEAERPALYYRPSAWYAAEGLQPCSDVPLCRAQPPSLGAGER
jgi:hypothetical protein